MSNYLTIACVTATIHDLVQAAVAEAVPGVTVRIGPPKAVLPTDSEVCLYLYHVTPNAQMRNAELPTRRADGSLAARSQSAIDLHYLIAFSGETQLATEIMLGKVMIALDARPVLTGAEIRRILRASGSYDYLKDSDLPAQLERIKITPQYLTLEEMTKLWSVFFQIAHRPALQYVASPILLDADQAPGLALPVSSASPAVALRGPPRIDRVVPAVLDCDGATGFRIEGGNFAPGAVAAIDGVALPTKILSESVLEIGAPPSSVAAGIKPLQVSCGAAKSDFAQLALRPVIRTAKFAEVADPFGGPTRMATIQLDAAPAIGSRQTPVLWLNLSPQGTPGYSIRSLLRRGLDPSFRADLDAKSISPRGRETLAATGLPSDGRFRFAAVAGADAWTLRDLDRGASYIVRADATDLMIYFGLAPRSPSTAVAFEVDVAVPSPSGEPGSSVPSGEYLVRLMVDSAPTAISGLAGAAPHLTPTVVIPARK